MALKSDSKTTESSSLQDVQRKLASFEDDVLAYLPSKEAILERAKQRQFKKKALGASVLSIFAVVFGVYGYNPIYEQFEAHTVKGQQHLVHLNDGTTIHLNTATHIQVRQRIRSQEIVINQGEASFHVAHSKSEVLKFFERPFKVTAGQMQVIDIGTIFNVIKHNKTDATVVVEQGEVAVKIEGSDKAMLHLVQGQSLSNYRQNLKPIRAVDVYSVQAWRSGDIVLNQTPLIEAIENFQRYADFEVDIQNTELEKIQVNGQFKARNYQQFMQVLPAVFKLDVEKTSDKKWQIK